MPRKSLSGKKIFHLRYDREPAIYMLQNCRYTFPGAHMPDVAYVVDLGRFAHILIKYTIQIYLCGFQEKPIK